MFPKKYITATNEYSTLTDFVPAPYFRKNFALCEEVKSAELLITGLGFYELHINGKNITKGLLAPYISNPEDYIYFDKYEIKPYLNKGKNVIAVILGNGFQNAVGGYIWDFDKAKWRSAPKLSFTVKITYSNGTIEEIESDNSVKTATSPILFDDLRYGEYYDANKEIKDWDTTLFDDSNWQNAIETTSPGGTEKICEAEAIVEKRRIAPISVTPFKDGFIYDFGVNSAGICELKISGESHQKVLLQHFETLVNNEPYLDNFRFNRDGMIDRYQEDIYYCSGKGVEIYKPHFTYHGFRYVYVTGITKVQATNELLTYIEMSSNLSVAGDFYCDNEIVNSIQDSVLRSDLSNFYYFPTDCPQREKNGWTSDAALSAEQLLYNFNPQKSYREWLLNIYKAMSDEGVVPGIIPTAGWGYDWGNGPAWGDNVIVNIPYFTYIYKGDLEILKEAAPAIEKYLTYLYNSLDNNNLLDMGLGDWCQPGRIEHEYDTPTIVTTSIMAVDIGRKSAFIFDVLGLNVQKEYALSLAEKITTAVREKLIDWENYKVFGNTQTSQAMAIYYNIFTKSEKKKALKQLVKLINEKDCHFDTGLLGGRVIFRLLAENEMCELAYKMITRPDYPSYGNLIKRGATTLHESFMPEDGRILSLNHHFWGDVSAWFYRYLAGIRVNPNKNDCSNIDISPCFIKDINFVKASHTTPLGKIQVEWHISQETATLSITKDNNIHGIITPPTNYKFDDGDVSKTLKNGQFIIRRI